MYQALETFLFRTPYFPFSGLSDYETRQQEPVFKEMLQIATDEKVMYSLFKKINMLHIHHTSMQPLPFVFRHIRQRLRQLLFVVSIYNYI